MQNLLKALFYIVLENFAQLGIPVLPRDVEIHDRPRTTRTEGIGTFNAHLWGGRDAPRSRCGPAETGRICSHTEVVFSVISSISGGGLHRFTDAGRSKVRRNVTLNLLNPKPFLHLLYYSQVIGENRSFVMNQGVAAFGYAAGFKSAGQSGEVRLKSQLAALKQMTHFGSRLLCR